MRNLARILLLVAMAATGMLVIDYTAPMPTYCDGGGGCAAVRASGLGYLGGVPLPIPGLIALASLFLLSLSEKLWARRLTLAGALVGALMATGLIGLQVLVIGHLCHLCMVVDASTILAACLLLVAHRPPRSGGGRRGLRTWAWVSLGVLAVAAATLWPIARGLPPLPAEIAALHVEGKLNVIEFADFECPFCRRLHPRLKRAIEAQPEGSVHLVRLNVPLPFHTRARGAALAQLCAYAQGQGDAMAHHLFGWDDTVDLGRSTRRSIAPDANRAAAQALGLDLAAYDACIVDEATDARLEEQIGVFEAIGGGGLPTTFIGEHVMVGAMGEERLAELFANPSAGRGVPAEAYLLLLALLIGGVVRVGRVRA